MTVTVMAPPQMDWASTEDDEVVTTIPVAVTTIGEVESIIESTSMLVDVIIESTIGGSDVGFGVEATSVAVTDTVVVDDGLVTVSVAVYSSVP